MAKSEIRRYGPGKFNTILDSYVYALAGEGWGGEQVGDAQDFGFYEVVPLGKESLKRIEEIAKEEQDTLTSAEKDLISKSEGAIFSENDQGFVDVDYYKTEKELDKAWKRVEEAAEEFYSEMEEEGSEMSGPSLAGRGANDLAVEFVKGATTGNAGSMYIHGKRVYSYGPHFPIAERHGGTIHITSRHAPSQTTATHVNAVKRAAEAEGFDVVSEDLPPEA